MPESTELIRRLSADLHRASSALDTLINTIPIGIGLAEDPDCRHIRINRAFAEQLGIQPTDNASLSAPPGERPPFRVFIEGREVSAEDLPMQYAARTATEVGPISCDVVHPNGRRVTLYEYAAPLFDEWGRVRGAIGVFVDITERRRAELEQRFLARAGEILSSSLDLEATFAAFAQLAVPVLGDYCALDVLRQDNSFERVEFVVHDPRLKEVAEGLKRYPPRLEVDSPAAQAIRTGVPVFSAQCPEDVLDRASQDAHHRALLGRLGVQSYMMVPLAARGHILGLFSLGTLHPARRFTTRDLDLAVEVGRRAALALDNARLYREAQDANRVKEDFLATLSHELRTPLNALLGWADMLKRRPDDETFRTRALESIERNAQAQAALIDDLLDVSRIMSGRLKVERMAVDLEAVLLNAVDAIRPLARAKEQEVALSIAPLSGRLVGDPNRLRQVIWNLLTNAVKFTPPRGTIEVQLRREDRSFQLTVTDTGVGIDPGFLPHVFERFRQADTSATRTEGGLGLGLSIVQHLVDLHGGSVAIDSNGPGTGTRAVVTLPAEEIAPSPETSASRPSRAARENRHAEHLG
jgi:signal transduction histidine kinase